MSSRLVQPFHLLCTAQPPCSSLCRKAPGHLMHHSSWWLHKNPRSWAGPAWGPGCLHPFATGCALPALPESSLIPWFLQQEAETLLFYPVLLAFDSHSSQFCKLLDPMSSFLLFFSCTCVILSWNPGNFFSFGSFWVAGSLQHCLYCSRALQGCSSYHQLHGMCVVMELP